MAEAPRPWHAFFYLRAQHQYMYRAGQALGLIIKNGDSSGGEHVFFHGQRCVSCEMKSSLQRKDPTLKGIEQRAIAALIEYFRFNFASNDDIATNTALCFAQHYGITTDLMDVSCDPDVSIWFATHPMLYEILDSKVRPLVRANLTFFKAFVEAAEGTNFDGFKVLRKVLMMARDELGI